MLEQAIDALKTYDWGADPSVLKPIQDAVVATHGDQSARKDLETRLSELLAGSVSRDAKDYICRQLMVIGTAASVPKLATMLADPELSHMARYALERITAPEAGEALREALPKLTAMLKIGVIGSLGVRGDAANVAVLRESLADGDANVASAAAYALGAIQTPEAAKALSSAEANDALRGALTDASMSCAEALLEKGQKAAALAIYKRFAGDDQPKHVHLAATRGILACAAK
jgi:HEAT repeat protein